MPNNDDEMRRRNEEMSMFAAYASITNADDDATKNNSNGSPFDGSSLLLLKPSASQGDDGDSCHLEADDVRFHDVSSKSSAMVAAPNKEEENANLSAAVAALSKGDGDNQQNSCARLWPAAATALHSHRRIRGTNAVKVVTAAPDLTAEDAMFAEEVVMPRPLFFGAIVPPRVLQAAKEMVEAAIEEMQAEGISSPRLHDLPDAVRNVVGTLRTYGFGLDTLLPCNRKPINSDVFSTNSKKRASFRELKSNEPWRGDGTVSTFQPVWGSDERTERIRKYKANRKPSKPAVISRISTAPPVMSAFTDDDESQDDEKSLDTEVTPSIHINSLTAPTVQRTSIKQFSAWLRSNDDEETMMTVESPFNLQSVGSSSQDGAEVFPNAAYAVVTSPEQLSEQEKFSQWALGSDSVVEVTGSAGKSYIVDSPSTNMGTFQFTAAHPFNASTFQQLHSNVARSRDDDEQNTQVGANDNLSKAIALLSEECSQAPDTPVVEPQVLLSQVDGSRKRPLTNYELTGGCVPIFSVDDTPLPHESDLGLHETKEEQRRSFEQKRSQEIIEKVVPPNVFGPVACPNPAINPDDFHAWNTRAIASQRAAPVTSATSIASDPSGFKRSNHGKTSSELMNRPALHSRPPKHPSKNPKNASKKRFTASRQRFGWWNELVETEDDAQTMEEKDGGSSKGDETDDLPSLHLPPAYHSSSSMHVFTPLEPSPEKLRDDNLPLSRMHAATSMAQTLPYLSDRPHSFRYLQVETQQIAFPPLKDEIEPLFCSMAIYNVETISSDMSMGVQSSLPIPDLQRCGRVTEALHFDHVTNTDVEARCGAALWPYSSNILSEKLTTSLGKEEKLCGTKCGVFPLPSNLNVANLYAVLIVRKVLSDEANLEPYLKLRKSTFDLDKLKQNAEKASNRNGKFVVPFAFGVAPLLQVFGTDNPVVASSRAVQIPLFHFSDGERQIFDHIMVMLFPR